MIISIYDRLIEFAKMYKTFEKEINYKTIEENAIVFRSLVITGSEVIMPKLICDPEATKRGYVTELQDFVDRSEEFA